MKDENVWTMYCEELQSWMKKEISTMREILATLHLESETSNEGLRKQLDEEKSSLINNLKEFRQTKDRIVKALMLLARCSEEELFTKVEKMDTEILILRDQIMALAERIHHENGAFHPHYSPSPATAPKTRKKNSIATIDTCEKQKPPA